MSAFIWANVPCVGWNGHLTTRYPAFLSFALELSTALGDGTIGVPYRSGAPALEGRVFELPDGVALAKFPYYESEGEVVRAAGPIVRAVARHAPLTTVHDVTIAVAPGIVGNLLLERAALASRLAVGVVRGSKGRSLRMIHGRMGRGFPYLAAAWVMDMHLRVLRARGVRFLGFGEDLARAYGGDGGVAVHPLVAEEFFQQDQQQKPTVDVVYVGRLSREKGVAVLLAAVEQLSVSGRRPVTTRIVGAGPDENELRTSAAVSAARISFSGHVPWGPQLIAEMRSARLFVLPSLTEGTPTALAEAMALGLPAVATDVGGVRRMAGQPSALRLVSPGDVRGLAAAIEGLLRDPVERRTLSLLARRRATAFDIRGEARRSAELVRSWL